MAIIEKLNASIPTNVVVHPIVLLSVVDHFNRVAKDSKKRVIGTLLGMSFMLMLQANTIRAH